MSGPRHVPRPDGADDTDAPRTLADFALASVPGNERDAIAHVSEVVQGLGLPGASQMRLETAVAEATMNAMEHGNAYRRELPVNVRVLATDEALFVRITDHGGGNLPSPSAEPPNLEAKLEGLQSPRGWGLFLIRSMVDELIIATDDNHHTVELVFHLKEDDMPHAEAALDVRKAGDRVSIIDVQGEFTNTAEAALMDAYNRASAGGTQAIILNFAGLEYMNSGGIGLLVTLLIRVNREKQHLLTFGLNDHYRSIFQITRLDDAIPIYASEAEAIQAANAR